MNNSYIIRYDLAMQDVCHTLKLINKSSKF